MRVNVVEQPVVPSVHAGRLSYLKLTYCEFTAVTMSAIPRPMQIKAIRYNIDYLLSTR